MLSHWQFGHGHTKGKNALQFFDENDSYFWTFNLKVADNSVQVSHHNNLYLILLTFKVNFKTVLSHL